MKTQTLKTLFLGILLLAFVQDASGQIGESRRDIIKEKGRDYEKGVTDEGNNYIGYEEEFTTERSGTYTRYKAYFFTKFDDGSEVCHSWKIIEPSSETNPWVSTFKRDLVEIGYMKWKDYESNIIYTVKVDEGFCIVSAWFDFDKQ